MDNEIKDKWISALESGDYEQCYGATHLMNWRNSDGRVVDRYCAMGVLYKVAPLQLVLTREEIAKVIDLNDKWKLSFHEIAIKIKEEF